MQMKKFRNQIAACTMALAVLWTAVPPIMGHAEGETTEGTSENYDVTAPVINTIECDKQGQTVRPGDKVKITVDAYDAGVGIDSVYVIISSQKKDHTGKSAEYYMHWNESAGKYELEITIDASFVGDNYMGNLTVKDKNGNTTEGIEVAPYLYTVEADATDTERPVIEAVQVTRGGTAVRAEDILVPGDTIHVSVKATDNMELGNSAWISLHRKAAGDSAATNGSAGFSISFREDSKSYEGDYVISEQLFPDIWEVSSVTVKDKSGNQTQINSANELMKGLEFTIRNDGFDTEQPVIQSVSLDKAGQAVHSGDSVKVSAVVTDNCGLDDVKVTMLPAALGYEQRKDIALTRVADTDTFEGSFVITDSTYPCEWYIWDIQVRDTSGNGSHKYRDEATGISYEESWYVNVMNGDTFVNPTYDVNFYYYNAEDEYVEKTIQVPRRTTVEEAGRLCTPEQHPAMNFQNWDGGDRRCILDNASFFARYDKVIVRFILWYTEGEEYDEETGETYPIDREKLVKKEYIPRGGEITVPRDIPGFENVVWYYDWVNANFGTGVISEDIYVLGNDYDDNERDFYGTATLSGDVPVTPDQPVSPGQPVDPDAPSSTETEDRPVVLTSQKIAEVIAQVGVSEAGDTVQIAMENATVVPKELLEAIKGKDITLLLIMDGYTWTIRGGSVLSNDLTDVNLKVIRNTHYIPNGLVEELAGSDPVEQISLEYNGDFGFTGVLTLNVGNQYTGKTGSLYYYDSSGKMVFMNAGTIDEQGNVSLLFSHASDYALVISGENAGSSGGSNTTTVSTVKTGDTTPVSLYGILLLTGAAGMITAAGVVVRQRRRER